MSTKTNILQRAQLDGDATAVWRADVKQLAALLSVPVSRRATPEEHTAFSLLVLAAERRVLAGPIPADGVEQVRVPSGVLKTVSALLQALSDRASARTPDDEITTEELIEAARARCAQLLELSDGCH